VKYPTGHYKTCLADKLDSFTQAGWTIVEAFDQDMSEHEIVTANRFGYADTLREPADCRYSGNIPAGGPLVTLSRRVFLLQKGTDVVDAELRQSNERLTASAGEAWKKEREGERLLAALRKEHEAKQEELKRAMEEKHSAIARSAGAHDRMRVMEGDIAKVRTAIGDREWTRILAESKKA
jgi:hypothetical protein